MKSKRPLLQTSTSILMGACMWLLLPGSPALLAAPTNPPNGESNQANSLQLSDLRCESLISPVGVEAAHPRFSWKLNAAPETARGLHQSAYRILVDSVHGRIISEWTRKENQVKMHIVILLNTTATVHVPAKDTAAVTENGKPAVQSPDVKFLRTEHGAAVFELGSGTYDFSTP
jgi:hypothetical protein